jgi:hypothetical protein
VWFTVIVKRTILGERANGFLVGLFGWREEKEVLLVNIVFAFVT